MVTFKPKEEKCNYSSLKIGNSDSVKIRDHISVSGYANRGLNRKPILQTVEGKVSGLDQLAEGYGISYQAFTVGGMSGGPVVDKKGEVVAIHGRTDFEIVQKWKSQQSSLSKKQ